MHVWGSATYIVYDVVCNPSLQSAVSCVFVLGVRHRRKIQKAGDRRADE
jgi:hypothetical protein